MVRHQSQASTRRAADLHHNLQAVKNRKSKVAEAEGSTSDTEQQQKSKKKNGIVAVVRKEKYRPESPPPAKRKSELVKTSKKAAAAAPARKSKPSAAAAAAAEFSGDEDEDVEMADEENDRKSKSRKGAMVSSEDEDEAEVDEEVANVSASESDKEEEDSGVTDNQSKRKAKSLVELEMARIRSEEKKEKERLIEHRRLRELRIKQRRKDLRLTSAVHFKRIAGVTPLKYFANRPGSTRALCNIIVPDNVLTPDVRMGIEQIARTQLSYALANVQEQRMKCAPVPRRGKDESERAFEQRRAEASRALRMRSMNPREVLIELTSGFNAYCPSFVTNVFNPILELYKKDDAEAAAIRAKKAEPTIQKQKDYINLKKRVTELAAIQNIPTFQTRTENEQRKIREEFITKEKELSRVDLQKAKKAAKAKQTARDNAIKARESFPTRVAAFQAVVQTCEAAAPGLLKNIRTAEVKLRDSVAEYKRRAQQLKAEPESVAVQEAFKEIKTETKKLRADWEKACNKLKSNHAQKKRALHRLKEMRTTEFEAIENRVKSNTQEAKAAKETLATVKSLARKIGIEEAEIEAEYKKDSKDQEEDEEEEEEQENEDGGGD